MIDDKNRIYFADYNCHTIWVFNHEGMFQHRFGSYGQGPGELISPVSLSSRNDTIAVLEAGNSRVSFFKATGKFLDAFAIPGGLHSGIEIAPNQPLIFRFSQNSQAIVFNKDTSMKKLPFPNFV